MKRIARHKQFKKHFDQRIAPNKKLLIRFYERVEMFLLGERGYPLNDHALTGPQFGQRAFSLDGDLRVIYLETDEAYIFLDIGSHNQVY